MLLVLMYHRILYQAFPEAEIRFRQHLEYLCQNFPIVTPGDPLVKNNLSVCLTFDDAYFDFYSFVFPLLQEYKIKAVLGVPVALVPEQITMATAQRLELIQQQPDQSSYENRQALCSWEELQHMAATQNVKIASHSYSHVDLTQPNVDLKLELQQSRYVLHNKLRQKINTFIYPYGKMDRKVHQQVKPIYPYIMRIGSSLNFNWKNFNDIIYRVDANHIWPYQATWSKKQSLKYFGKLLSNIVRNK